MAGAQAYPRLSWTMAGPVATVAQFGEPDRDGGNPTEDALDRVSAIWTGGGGGRVQVQGFLGLAHQLGQIGLVTDGQAPFCQNDLGGAFDQLFGAAYGQGGSSTIAR